MGVVICSEEIDEGKLSETEGVVDKKRSSESNGISFIVGEKISIGKCENYCPDIITEVNTSDKGTQDLVSPC
uniref:Uncharacterized protein n=1 Tax=Kalanchoe fedtschenkoi TaxID=63787 RepID=A0A7N1A1M2_KALFE